jgi:hypothetical protein
MTTRKPKAGPFDAREEREALLVATFIEEKLMDTLFRHGLTPETNLRVREVIAKAHAFEKGRR